MTAGEEGRADVKEKRRQERSDSKEKKEGQM